MSVVIYLYQVISSKVKMHAYKCVGLSLLAIIVYIVSVQGQQEDPKGPKVTHKASTDTIMSSEHRGQCPCPPNLPRPATALPIILLKAAILCSLDEISVITIAEWRSGLNGMSLS